MAWIDYDDWYAWRLQRVFDRFVDPLTAAADPVLDARIVYTDALDAEYTDDDDALREP